MGKRAATAASLGAGKPTRMPVSSKVSRRAAPPHQYRKTRRTLAQQDEAGGVARPHAAARRRRGGRRIAASLLNHHRSCTDAPGLSMDAVLAWMMARTEITGRSGAASGSRRRPAAVAMGVAFGEFGAEQEDLGRIVDP